MMAGGPYNSQPDPSPTGPQWEEAGGIIVPWTLVALRRPLPELLFILYDPRRKRYCYRRLPAGEDCGLVCFATHRQARAYISQFLPAYTYDEVRFVSLDQAHRMARERHVVVNCLILVDETFMPHVHHIR